MLELLGTVAGNILSLPGILGFAFGMMTRSLPVAAILGAIIGVGEEVIFAGFALGEAAPLELAISALVGVIFALLGSLTRRKGATV